MANTIQHLVLFLDGTWNTEDDTTNILSAFHNTIEGPIPNTNIIQKRYYDRGVGTSVLDSVTGGGFGIGLDKNVREAYNWLIDNYNDKNDNQSKTADKIFIFGFSRGAYTARSLVGLIGACGLMKKGAPLTTNQMWNGYTFISQQGGKGDEWWEKTLKAKGNEAYFARKTKIERRKGKDKYYNEAEQLVTEWSRRVEINYLGIYDTVGALGIHALGIPGLNGALDAGHNIRPTSIIQKCRHAMAIDEHRSSFRLTTMLDFEENDQESKSVKSFKDNIRQRWFAGAHSNVGGGYPNNVLSHRPYEWIMEGAQNANLKIDKIPQAQIKDEKNHIRDSFAEFVGLIYPQFVRSKRNYRPMGWTDEVRSTYSLRPINEEIDNTVLDLVKTDESYRPPNLISYLYRHPNKVKGVSIDTLPQKYMSRWPGEMLSYNGKLNQTKNYIITRLILLIWSIVAAYGLLKLTNFLWVETLTFPAYLLPLLTGLFVVVDWAETKTTLSKCLYPQSISTEACWNVLYWIRIVGVVAAALGIGAIGKFVIGLLIEYGFSFGCIKDWGMILLGKYFTWKLLYAVIAGIGAILILDLISSSHIKLHSNANLPKFSDSFLAPSPKKKISFLPYILSGLLMVLGLYLLYNGIERSELESGVAYNMPGALLLLLLLCFGFYHLLGWVGKPIRKQIRRKDVIQKMQNATSNAQLTSLFTEWQKGFTRNWFTTTGDDSDSKNKKSNTNDIYVDDDIDGKILTNVEKQISLSTDEEKHKVLAWLRLRDVLKKALWRDILGFVPYYSFMFLCILSIGSYFVAETITPWQGVEFSTGLLIVGLVGITALCDMIENVIHLKHIENHSHKTSSTFFVLLGTVFTTIKMAGFFIMLALSFVTLFFVGKHLLSTDGPFKWEIITLLVYILLIIGFIKIIGLVKNRFL